MVTRTPGDSSGFHMGTRDQILAAWPLGAAAVTMVVAVTMGTRLDFTETPASTVTMLVLLATLAGGAGAIGLVRSPSAPAAKPFLRLASVVAALLALMPLLEEPGARTLSMFLLAGPWEYAVAPVLVHVAFAIGWPHRRRYWSGLVIGWYLIHLALFVSAASGLIAGRSDLTEIVDYTFFRSLFSPAGVFTAIAALLVALGSPSRRGAHRRAVTWMLAAIILGFGPGVIGLLTPELIPAFDGTISPDRMAMVMGVFLGLAAVLAVPLANDAERDLTAHGLAQMMLDEPDLHNGLVEIAAVLKREFDVDGVSIRLTTPPIEVVEGETRSTTTGPIAPSVETIDDRRTLLAPIGRVGDPLGEVRLDARFAGAFALREREWLAAFLFPIATTLRARRRESLQEARLSGLLKEMLGLATELREATATVPTEGPDHGMAVPPPVDASEVLGQLTDGLKSISRRSDDLEGAAGEAQEKVSGANRRITEGMAALDALYSDVIRLTKWSEEIGLANQAIDNVAFRIDLLANNAAIEAGRAGAAGKTFAVLAEEIRRLANTTAGSSSAIQGAAGSLAEEVHTLSRSVESVQNELRTAIHDAESGEVAAGKLSDIAAQMVSQAHSFGPIVDEAYAVAKRRTERDETLTHTLERLIHDRESLAADLVAHRATLDRVRRDLQKIAGRPTR